LNVSGLIPKGYAMPITGKWIFTAAMDVDPDTRNRHHTLHKVMK